MTTTPPAQHGSLHCDSAGFIQPFLTRAPIARDRIEAEQYRALRRIAVLNRDVSMCPAMHAHWSEMIRFYDDKLNASHTEKA